MKNKFFGLLTLFLLLLFSYKAVRPLFVPGFFPMHDDTQPARVYEMARALASGQFPVRWVPDLGYGFGYPLFNFYGPLPYYIGALFNLFGFDAIAGAKAMIIIGILLSVVTMYIFISSLFGNIAGVVISILYLYAPYHAVNVYVRGAIGELFAYGFLPLVVYGFYKIMQMKERKQAIIIGALGIAGILLSHNIIGMLTLMYIAVGLVFLFCFLLVQKQSLTPFFLCLLLIFLGIGLSSFFVLPAFFEKSYTRVAELTTGGSDFRNHFVYIDQLWDSPWGYAGSAPGKIDGMSFKLGKVHVLLGFLSFPLILFLYKKKKIRKDMLVLFVLLFCVLLSSLFLTLPVSGLIWEKISWFAYVQYPWRHLNFILLGLCVLSSVLFLPLKRNGQLILGGIILFFTLYLNTKYFVPREYISVEEQDYIAARNLQGKISRISDEYLPKEFIVPQEVKEKDISELTDNTSILVKEFKGTPTDKTYTVEVKTNEDIITNTTFFPGWKVFIDGSLGKITNQEGRIRIENVPAGTHKVRLVLTNTFVRILGNTISFFSLFLLVYVSLFLGKMTIWQKGIQSK